MISIPRKRWRITSKTCQLPKLVGFHQAPAPHVGPRQHRRRPGGDEGAARGDWPELAQDQWAQTPSRFFGGNLRAAVTLVEHTSSADGFYSHSLCISALATGLRASLRSADGGTSTSQCFGEWPSQECTVGTNMNGLILVLLIMRASLCFKNKQLLHNYLRIGSWIRFGAASGASTQQGGGGCLKYEGKGGTCALSFIAFSN